MLTVYGLGFGVWGLGFGVWGGGRFLMSEVPLYGLGFGVWGVPCNDAPDSCFAMPPCSTGTFFAVLSPEFRVYGSGFTV